MTETRRLTAAQTGLHDRTLEGWFNGKTGELAPGARIHSTDTVVDIGCGDGGFINFCGRQGAEVIFIDRNEVKVEATRQRMEKTAARAFRGIVSLCDPVPLPDGMADKVVCTEVLEHVADPGALLAEMVRITRPGGTLLLTVPDHRSEAFVAASAPPQYFQEPNHIRIFSSDQFRALVDEAGLTVESHQFIGAFWSVYWPLAWLVAEPGEGLPIDCQHPMVTHWTALWQEVQAHPEGHRIRDALNQLLPKSQTIVAHKAEH